MVLAQPYGGPHALVGVRRRHPHVRDDDVRELRPAPASSAMVLTSASPVAHPGDDIVPTVGQQPGQALPQQHRILGDDHPHSVLHVFRSPVRCAALSVPCADSSGTVHAR